MENIDKIYDLLDSIEVTRENDIEIANIKKLLSAGNYLEALKKMRELKDKEEKAKKKQEELLDLVPEAEVARCEKMLSNPGFVNKAPEKKIQEEKDKLEKYKDMLAKVEERLK